MYQSKNTPIYVEDQYVKKKEVTLTPKWLYSTSVG